MTTKSTVRCAIYTRVSTDQGLEQDFNSLDAQYDAAQAYIRSQAHASWTLLRTKYDDGGFSGGNTDRPALQRLLEDVRAGKIDVIVVYKVDRLTRSLADFAKLVELFDQFLLPDGIRPEHARPMRSETRARLVAAIARGRRWLDNLIADPTASADSIAQRERCSARKINMTISWPSLPPISFKRPSLAGFPGVWALLASPTCRRSGLDSTRCSAFLRNNRTHTRTDSLSVVVSVRGNGIFAAETKAPKSIGYLQRQSARHARPSLRLFAQSQEIPRADPLLNARSQRLIIVWSEVRVLPAPPLEIFATEFIFLFPLTVAPHTFGD